MHRDATLGRSQKHHAAHLRQPQCRSHIERTEYGFHSERIGRILVHQRAKQSVDLLEDCTETFLLPLRRNLQCTIAQHAAATAIALDDSVSGGSSGGGVDSQYAETTISGGGNRGWVCNFHRLKSTVFPASLPELCL
jgi:hypothetical protein